MGFAELRLGVNLVSYKSPLDFTQKFGFSFGEGIDFGNPRQKGTSHLVYKTPWQGDPRVNIQNKKGKAKPYQVKQVLEAIAKLERSKDG